MRHGKKANLKKAAQTPGLGRKMRVKHTGTTGDKGKGKSKKLNPGYR